MLHEFTINVPFQTIEAVMEKLNTAGMYHLYYEEPIEIIKVQNGYGVEQKENANVDLKIYASEDEVDNLPTSYFEKIEETLSISKEQIQYVAHEEENWESSYEFDDVDLGNDWVITYPHSTNTYEGKHILKFDPLAAFGTGLHETTQGCLKLLVTKDVAGKKILDLGTGSGMLSVAASIKGAKKVVAIDYEPVEREVLHNAKLNGLTNELEVIQADLIDGDFTIDEHYDLILINIGADETMSILTKHDLLKNSNEFIISGLVEWHLDSLIEQFEKGGFEIVEKLQLNEWVSIYFRATS